jgi:hypothetical protein
MLIFPHKCSNMVKYGRGGGLLSTIWRQLDGSILTIDRAWKTTTEVGPPKWGKVREIPLPAAAVDILADVKLDSVRVADNDLIFCYDAGPDGIHPPVTASSGGYRGHDWGYVRVNSEKNAKRSRPSNPKPLNRGFT